MRMIFLSLRIPVDMVEKLNRLAKQARRTRSDYVRLLLEKALARTEI